MTDLTRLESPLPVLSDPEVQAGASIIARLYSSVPTIEEQHALQNMLSDLQKRPEAWGLVLPFVQHPDPNIQFIGAHTAVVKIARDWDSFPAEQAGALKDVLLDLTGRACGARISTVAVRKLFVALVRLASRIAPLRPSQWPDWIMSSIAALSGRGASPEQILEFLSIAAEEATLIDWTGGTKMTFQQTMLDAVPMVLDAVEQSCSRSDASPREKEVALKCLQRWVEWGLSANDVLRPVPMLISLLSSENTFIGASDVLQEILATYAGGKGTKSLTEPLLNWMQNTGRAIYEQAISSGFPDENTHSLSKLVIALAEQASTYIAENLAEARIQSFLSLILAFTNFPGVYAVDEEESEIVLPFWYVFQEILMEADFAGDQDGKEWALARMLFTQLVVVLRAKAMWPTSPMSKDLQEKFRSYRRDIGDALVNAYYILRDDMMSGLIDLLYGQLHQPEGPGYWESVESTLFVLKSIQEAVPLEEQEHLPRLWAPEVLNRISSSSDHRTRQTMLSVIAAYSSWFPKADPTTVLSTTGFTIGSLGVPEVSLAAAEALKELCNKNGAILAQHSLNWFSGLYSQLDSIPETEKSKVLQSISSVVGALPPDDAVAPVMGVVSPLVIKLYNALSTSSRLPEEARYVCVNQLHYLAACAKGLTQSRDYLEDILGTSDEEEMARRQRIHILRGDDRLLQMRASILQGIEGCFSLWSTDAEVADALSELLRAITGLEADETLISLEPEPLLRLVCAAAARELTAVWLSLAQILITQLDPKKFMWIRPQADPASLTLVRDATLSLLTTAVGFLSQPGAMEANTDIVQDFFGSCMTAIAMHFIVEMYKLPPDALNNLITAAIVAMALPERYCIVSAARFLHTFVDQTLKEANANAKPLNAVHGYPILNTVLHGIAARAPRSTIPNLADLLAIMSSRFADEARPWIRAILFSPEFAYPKATVQAKETFMKALARHKRISKVKEAANEFALVVRGLDGSGFGYASAAA